MQVVMLQQHGMLENQYAICKLQFTDENGTTISDIEKLTITNFATDKVVSVTPPAAQPALYVAMLPSTDAVRFTIERSDGVIYTKLSNSNLQAGKFYHPTLPALRDIESTPLLMMAKESGTISFQNKATGSVYYRIGLGELIEIPAGTTGTTPTLSAGQRVAFYGDNAAYATSVFNNYSTITCTADCYVYGNIMSLIKSTDFKDCKKLTDSFAFYRLFYSNTHLLSHADKELVLPATTLAVCCYSGMFQECTSLATAPDLPATSLEDNCYDYMFYGCTNLSRVKCLAQENVSMDYTTRYWLQGVAPTGTFIKAPQASWTTDEHGIPEGWVVETESE